MVGERRRPVPTERRRLGRRRARARALARFAVPMAVSAVVVVLAVTAVAQIGAASGPYRRTVDRGYAALVAPLVADSNASGAALVAFLRAAPSLGRVPFFSDLGAFVADTAALVRRYEAIARPGPSDAASCVTALSDRAEAVAHLRGALEAVLGGPTGLGVVAQDADVTAAAAAAATLRGADVSWASCRRTVRRGAGSALACRRRRGRIPPVPSTPGPWRRWWTPSPPRTRWRPCTTSRSWPWSPSPRRCRAGRPWWSRRPKPWRPTSCSLIGATSTRPGSSSAGRPRRREPPPTPSSCSAPSASPPGGRPPWHCGPSRWSRVRPTSSRWWRSRRNRRAPARWRRAPSRSRSNRWPP